MDENGDFGPIPVPDVDPSIPLDNYGEVQVLFGFYRASTAWAFRVRCAFIMPECRYGQFLNMENIKYDVEKDNGNPQIKQGSRYSTMSPTPPVLRRTKLCVYPTRVVVFPFAPDVHGPWAENGARMMSPHPSRPP